MPWTPSRVDMCALQVLLLLLLCFDSLKSTDAYIKFICLLPQSSIKNLSSWRKLTLGIRRLSKYISENKNLMNMHESWPLTFDAADFTSIASLSSILQSDEACAFLPDAARAKLIPHAGRHVSTPNCISNATAPYCVPGEWFSSGPNFIELLKQKNPCLVKSDYQPRLHSIAMLSKQQLNTTHKQCIWHDIFASKMWKISELFSCLSKFFA